MKHKFLLGAFLLFALPYLGFSQEGNPMSLSLKQAQEFAVQNNLTLKNANLDINIAEKKVWETTAIGLPQINGAVNYQYIPGELPTFSFTDSSTMKIYNYIFTSLEALGYPPSADLFSDDNAEPLTLGVKNSTTYSVTVSQLVFSGEYIVGLQASKTFLQISKLAAEKQLLDLKGNVISGYISVLVLERNLEIIDSSLINMQLLLSETKQMFKQGFMESTDADQLQITLNTLTNAKNTIARQLEISKMLLKITLGVDVKTDVLLTENLEEINTQLTSTIRDISAFNIENNIDYKLVDNQVAISELSYKREKTKYLPTISAFYNYQDKTNKASFDFTINHIIGVNLNMPIFSSFQRNATVQQAKLELEKSMNNKALFENSLVMQLNLANNNYYNALEKFEVTAQNAKLSRNVFENTSKKYKVGMASSMELTMANNTFLQSQSDNISALYELLTSKIELDKIVNEL
jgi:outer membrane protein TolC